ncbi:MAG: polysaccharide biosynthesis tyrosine autokinase [Cyanobacteria bacterium P01_D01_bin.6]
MLTNPAPSTVTDESEFGYGQLFGVLIRRSIWIGGAIIGALGIAAILTLREEPVYQSSMQLLIEPNYRQTVNITGQEDGRSSSSQADYATQLNLMRSNTFVEQAIEKLLENDPEFCRGASDSAECVGRFQGALALSQLVEGGTETRIFEASFRANDPAVVQVFLEALGEVYLEYNEERQAQRLEQGLKLVNQRIEETQNTLEGSRQALKQFREAENLINPEQQALAVAGTVRSMEQSAVEIESQVRDVQASFDAIQTQLNADPEMALISSRLSQSSRYQQLLNALQATELALAQRLSLYAEADPGVQDLDSQRQRQVSLLQAEVIRVLGEIPGQLELSETALLSQGQLGAIDLQLVNDLVQAQVTLRSLEARQAWLDQTLQAMQTEFQTFPNLIAEYDRIQPEIEIQQQSLEQLLRSREEISNELAQGGFSWNIVEAAQTGKKISPQPGRNLLLGLVAGAFVGGILAFGREALDNVVRTSDELKKQVALPLLGMIPEIPRGELASLSTRMSDNAAMSEPFPLNQWPPFRDAIDLIYKTIQITSAQPLSSLMVTSARTGEGKTTLAIGLALSAARSHQRVLLIDANLRHPAIHKQLSILNKQGLTAYLQPEPNGQEPPNSPLTRVSVAGTMLDVLPAGAGADDPVSLLSSLSMQQLLATAEAKYDLVILDTPAILGMADGLQLASMCKGVVAVSRLDQTTQADLTRAVAILNQVNTVGIVANGYQEERGGEERHHQNGHVATSVGGVPKITSIFRRMGHFAS